MADEAIVKIRVDTTSAKLQSQLQQSFTKAVGNAGGGSIFSKAAGGIGKFATLNLKFLAQILAMLERTPSLLAALFSNLFGGVITVLKFLADKIVAVARGIMRRIIDFFQGVFDFGTWLLHNIPEFIAGIFNFGNWILENISNFITGVFNLGSWLLSQASNFITGVFNLGSWLLSQASNFITGVFNIGSWLRSKASDFIDGVFDLGDWLEDRIHRFIDGSFDFGDWLWDKIDDFISGTFSIGNWLDDRIDNFISGTFDFGQWLLDHIWDFITGVFSGSSGGIFGDFIAQKGRISKFSPDDTVIGVKDVESLGRSQTINVTVDNMLGASLVDEITMRVREELFRT